jgi:hypothetical protein
MFCCSTVLDQLDSCQRIAKGGPCSGSDDYNKPANTTLASREILSVFVLDTFQIADQLAMS